MDKPHDILPDLADLADAYEALAELMAAQDQRSPALALLHMLNRQFRAALDGLDAGGLLS